METQLKKIIQFAIEALEDANYNESTINEYRKTFRLLMLMAESMHTDCYSPELVQKFIMDTTSSKTEKYSLYRDKRHKRCIQILGWYEQYGYFNLNAFVSKHVEMPVSRDYQKILSFYLQYLSDKGLASNTIDSFRNISSKFLRYLESVGYQKLTTPPTVVPDFVASIRNKWADGSLRTALSGLRSFFAFTESTELLNAVPGKALRSRKIISVLTESENQALIKTLNSDQTIHLRDKAIVLLSLITGLRACDIVNLQLSDINWRTDSITIIQQKTGKPLSLPLMPSIGNALAKYIIRKRPKSNDHHVFFSLQAQYRPLTGHSSCYKIIEKILRKADIHLDGRICGTRLLRHNAASKMMKNGISVQTIASVLGHTGTNTTGIYLTTDEKHLRECALPLSIAPIGMEVLR